MLLLWTILFILLLLVGYYVVPALVRHARFQRDYRTILGLPISSIPFVGNLHQCDSKTYVFYRFILQMGKQCQEQNKGLFILWYSIWPIIFLCSGEGMETFISKHLRKSSDYRFLEPWLKTGLLNSSDAKWRSRRRLITPSFHDNHLLHSFMLIFNDQAKILAHRLDECAQPSQGGKTYDLYPYISACTLDIIAEAATGTHPGAQLTDANNGKNDFVEATGRIGEITTVRSRSPWMWPGFIFNRLSIGREYKKKLEILHDFSRKVIQERMATFHGKNNDENDKPRRLAFLDNLLAQMEAEQLTLDDVQEEVDTFMFEGHDTTAAAVNFFCYLVGCHPDIQAKIHAEMDAIFGDDLERPCTTEDAQQMTYLDCVIKESMRLLPPVPLIGRDAQEDFVYRGETIRKGTTVYIFITAIHHDANVFPDPDKFDPDRFSDSTVTSENRSSFAFIPFSAGSRNCIGQRFAGLEERVILSTLFRRFSFRSTQTIDQLRLSCDVILRPWVPIAMIIERRHRH